jgi:hypothetical protein
MAVEGQSKGTGAMFALVISGILICQRDLRITPESGHLQCTSALFDHLVGAHENSRRNRYSEITRGPQVYR